MSSRLTCGLITTWRKKLTLPRWGWYPSIMLPFFIILSLTIGATWKQRQKRLIVTLRNTPDLDRNCFFALWSFFEVSESYTPCLSSSCLPQETLRLKPEGLEADCALRPWGSGIPRGIRARSKSLKSLLLAAFICHMGKLGLRFLSPRFRKVWTQAEHQLQPVKGTVYLLVLTRLSVITCTSWPLSHHICKAALPRGHSPLKPCEPWAAREVRVMQY